MNLTPPMITMHWDMTTHKYVAQTVYKDGKDLKPFVEADTLKELVEAVHKYYYECDLTPAEKVQHEPAEVSAHQQP